MIRRLITSLAFAAARAIVTPARALWPHATAAAEGTGILAQAASNGTEARGAAPATPAAGSTTERTLWYVDALFTYTNQLMERAQTWCNYLILANSVAGVAFYTIMNALLSNRGHGPHFLAAATVLRFALAPSALFLSSIVAAVSAFTPRIYDHKIELNHDFIARMSPEAYQEFVRTKPDEGKLGDFMDEIHVLSRILNDRTRRVAVAARLFVLAATSALIVVACTAA